MNAFVDASIIVGILRNEDDSEELAERLNTEAPHLYISPLVRFEAVSALVKIEVEILQNKTGKVTPADRCFPRTGGA